MTPGARIAAATEILDAWNEGDAVEKLLTNWGRRSRFAGSKDRAAVRDLVFDALRNLNRYAAIGKGWNGRALMIGRLFALGEDPDQYFTGEGYMPEALSDEERLQGDTTGIVNLQDWILPKMQDSLESDFDANEKALCCRAPLFLRVNTEQTNVEDVIARLAKEQIIARPHPLSPTALEVTENPRRFAGSEVFRTGLAEIQDAASQAVSDLVPVTGRAPQSVGQLRFWDDLTY
ncbi:MAG: RsmB/NOP family class I SAM-dependent RNA methyltransferase, partial [Halocynthiibacter sp.]